MVRGDSFGPRLLTDALPALVLFLAPAWERVGRSAPLRVVAGLLLALSVLVQVVEVTCYPSPRDVAWNTAPPGVPLVRRLWDWRDPQLLRLVRNGVRPPGFDTDP